MSNLTAEPERDAWQYCREQVGGPENDGYLVILFSTDAERKRLTGFYALLHELERTVSKANEPSVARIRLAWWREETSRWLEGQPQHPITRLLGMENGARLSLSLLQDLISAYELRLVAQNEGAEFTEQVEKEERATTQWLEALTRLQNLRVDSHQLVAFGKAIAAANVVDMTNKTTGNLSIQEALSLCEAAKAAFSRLSGPGARSLGVHLALTKHRLKHKKANAPRIYMFSRVLVAWRAAQNHARHQNR